MLKWPHNRANYPPPGARAAAPHYQILGLDQKGKFASQRDIKKGALGPGEQAGREVAGSDASRHAAAAPTGPDASRHTTAAPTGPEFFFAAVDGKFCRREQISAVAP